MSIRQEARLDPPAPPQSGRRVPRNVLLTTSGLYIHFGEDGSASLIDGIQEITLAEFTAEQGKEVVRALTAMIGGTR